MATGANPKRLSLMPREHGAYAQLGISLAMALAFVPGSLRAWGQALATVLVFLASEPVLVLLGRRGEASTRLGTSRARRRLACYLPLLILLLTWVWAGNPLRQVLSILPAMAFGGALLGLFLARREHSISGELLAAAALSFAGLPVMVAGGLELSRALLATLGLAILNGLGTGLVRCFLASLKRAARWPRLLPILLGVALAAGAGLAFRSWMLALAPLPLTVVAFWMWVVAPRAIQLRMMGWLLTVATALGALAMVLARG